MKTIIDMIRLNRNRQGRKYLGFLFALTLFFICSHTQADAKQTFGPPAHEDTFDCSKVQWLQKTHEYVGFQFKSVHKYLFRGKWAQQACAAEGTSCFTQYWDIEVSGIYREETDRFNESVTFKGKLPTNGGYFISVDIKFLTDGKMTSDPWIFPTFAVTDFTAKCILNHWTYPNGGVTDIPGVPYFEIPAIFFSRCAFTAAERGALGKEKPVPLTCTDNQIKAKPTVVAPTPNQLFGNYKDAYAAVEMPCLPPMPESTANGFSYVLEEKIVENNGAEYWLPFCNPCAIAMVPSKYNYVSKGLKKLGLERPGYYRIKFNQQVQTQANLIGGDYTDWIYFSVGPRKISNLAVAEKQKIVKPGAAISIQNVAPPAVIVNSIRINPAKPKAGQVFDIYIDFFNKGKGPTRAGQKYYATCTPQNGGAPVWNPGPHPVEQIIQPNQSLQVIFKGSIKNPGTYVLAVKPDPMASDVTFAKLITFTVEPLVSIKPKPGMIQKQ